MQISMPTAAVMGANQIASAFGPVSSFMDPTLEATKDAMTGKTTKGNAGGGAGGAGQSQDKTSQVSDLAQSLQLQQAELQRLQQDFLFQSRQVQLGIPGAQPSTQFAGLLSAKSSEVSMLQRRLDELLGGGSLGGKSARPLGSDQPPLSFFA
jgi:hypothetical protein